MKKMRRTGFFAEHCCAQRTMTDQRFHVDEARTVSDRTEVVAGVGPTGAAVEDTFVLLGDERRMVAARVWREAAVADDLRGDALIALFGAVFEDFEIRVAVEIDE